MNFFNNNSSQLYITCFCDWFAKLSIEKYQTVSVSGNDYFVQRKVIKIPCQIGSREKFYEIVRSSSARRNMNPDLNNKLEMQWILPRISVNQTGMSYDSSRRLVKTQKMDDIQNSANSKTSVYSPAPYNLELEVSTISRNIDENFQLMEQIIPFFSPTMNLNVKVYPNAESQSIPITLNSVSIDNPTDIPENDERLFTNTYNFTMKVNYFIPKKTQGLITNIVTTMTNGIEVLKLDKQWIESLNVVQDKFTQYIANSILPVPINVTSSIGSTYTKTEYIEDQEGELISNILSALDNPSIILNQSVSAITLTPALSGTNLQYQKNIAIFYRLDSSDIVYEYTIPLDITFTKIYYWINLTTKTDNVQLEVYQYMVI